MACRSKLSSCRTVNPRPVPMHRRILRLTEPFSAWVLASGMALVIVSAREVQAQPRDGAAAPSPAAQAECMDAVAELEAAVEALAAAHRKALAAPAVAPASAPIAPQGGTAASSPAAPRPDARLQALRARAARLCLGTAAALAAPVRRPVVPMPRAESKPPGPLVVPRPRASKPEASLPPTPRAAPSPFISACDASGCWASDGTRLNRAGPVLLGPRGVCTQAGTLLQCP